MVQQGAGRSGMAPILAIVGGALAGLGSFLAWAKVSAEGLSVSTSGTDGSDGWITLAAGVVLVVSGLLVFRGAGRKAIAVLAVVAGIVAGGLAVYDALTAEDRIIDEAAGQISTSLGVSKDDAKGLLTAAIDLGQIDLSLAFGIYLVIAGGALGVVGGGLATRAGSAPIPATAPVMPVMPAPVVPVADPQSILAEPAPSVWAPPAPSEPESPMEAGPGGGGGP